MDREFRVGDLVNVQIPQEKKPRETNCLRGEVLWISECGRYAIVRGRRSWSRRAQDYAVKVEGLRHRTEVSHG